MPNVVGQDAASAANILGQALFKVSTKTQPSDTVEAGKVISTSPPAGAKAAKGSTVTMVVSSGPSPTTTSPPETTTTQSNTTATVPNLFNDTQSQADAVLAARGFSSSCQATGVAGNGRVVSQNPSAGTQAQRGSTVSYTINDTSCA